MRMAAICIIERIGGVNASPIRKRVDIIKNKLLQQQTTSYFFLFLSRIVHVRSIYKEFKVSTAENSNSI
jgi:hypothetical protein